MPPPSVCLAADYRAPTPAWAVFGSAEGGFDPADQRVKKVRNHPGRSEATSTVGADD